jgi:hypothetical protein
MQYRGRRAALQAAAHQCIAIAMQQGIAHCAEDACSFANISIWELVSCADVLCGLMLDACTQGFSTEEARLPVLPVTICRAPVVAGSSPAPISG